MRRLALIFTFLFVHYGAAFAAAPVSTIEYITDLEGNAGRLHDFLEHSDTFEKNSQGEWSLKPGTHFVYGGDAIDRDAGDLEILRFLVEQKERHPDQVTLLLGNRDLNKMPILDIARDFARDADIKSATEKLRKELDGVNAPKAFEFRRAELATSAGRAVPDAEVTKNFLREIEPGGLAYRYLEAGQIAKVIDGNLFTHGLVTEKNLGVVPGKAQITEDIRASVNEVNQWKEREFKGWAAGRGGNELHGYQLPSAKSLVNSRLFDANNNPLPTSPALVKKLSDQNIRRIVSGHTPQPNLPTIIREPNFESIIGDNSYTAGHGAARLRLRGKDTFIQSTLPGGRQVTVHTQIGSPSLIGQTLPEGGIVSGQLDNGDYVIAQWLKGFKAGESQMTAEKLTKLLKTAPAAVLSPAIAARFRSLGYSESVIAAISRASPAQLQNLAHLNDEELKPLTLYRGLSVSPKNFDPSFQSKDFADVFTSNKIGVALNYADAKGTVVEYQIPKAWLKEYSGNYTPETIKKDIRIFTFSRRDIPSDALFLSRLGVPGSDLASHSNIDYALGTAEAESSGKVQWTLKAPATAPVTQEAKAADPRCPGLFGKLTAWLHRR